VRIATFKFWWNDRISNDKTKFQFNREWEENSQLWVQKVSSTPATRLDVINLQEQLDHMLQKRQARETGICPVRRELYSQCFGTEYYDLASLL
jgi:hypothetical protein